MKDVEEQLKHPQPARHSDNEKSKLPPRDDDQQRLKRKPEGEPPVE